MEIKGKEKIFVCIVEDFIDIIGAPYKDVDFAYLKLLFQLSPDYTSFKKKLCYYLLELI